MTDKLLAYHDATNLGFVLIPTPAGLYDVCELATGIVIYSQTLERIEQILDFASDRVEAREPVVRWLVAQTPAESSPL